MLVWMDVCMYVYMKKIAYPWDGGLDSFEAQNLPCGWNLYIPLSQLHVHTNSQIHIHTTTMSPLTTQRLKFLLLLSSLLLTLSRLPLWALKYALTRQHPSYSFRQALSIRLVRSVMHSVSLIKPRTPLPLTPGKEGKNFVLITPAPKHASKYQGPMKEDENVGPDPIGAVWYPSPPSATDKEEPLVMLHLHGGAYVIGDGRNFFMRPFAGNVLSSSPATHILCPSYRLSSLPPGRDSNAFPTALIDALTSYLYLLHEMQIPASRIVLSGDSAGGNCAVALLKYVALRGGELEIPTPLAATLYSPWIDPTLSPLRFEEENPNAGTDLITSAFFSWGVAAFNGDLDFAVGRRTRLAGNPYVDVSKGFRTESKVWVNVGGLEVLRGEGEKWVGEMQRSGTDVVIDVEEGACHDVVLLTPFLGMEREARGIADRGGQWLRGVVAGV